MHKRFLLFVLATVCFSAICVAQNNSVNSKALKLKRLYQLASTSADKKKYEVQFFNEFPNSFSDLNNLYGYINNKPAPLYYDAEKHIIELFNNLKSVNDTIYYKKIIAIAKNAHWDADAISYFQSGLTQKVMSNPKLTLYILQSKSKKEIIGFWAFYFDHEGVATRKGYYEDLLKKIPTINRYLKDLITAGYIQSAKNQANSH